MAKSRQRKAQAARAKASRKSPARRAPGFSSVLERLADRLRELREEAGKTQEQVGWDAQIDPKRYAAIENARAANVTLATLTGIAKALGVTLSELLEGVGP